MNQMSLDAVSKIYDCARLARFEVHQVDNAEFRRFCLSLREFERSLGESVGDDYWRPFLWALKRYRFDMSSTPLPFQYPEGQSPSLVERMRGTLAHCDLIYPQFVGPARKLVDRLQAVSESQSNPVLSVCADIVGCGGEDVGILIKEPRLIPAVELMLSHESGVGEVEVIGPSQLKGHRCYSRLIVIGPARWYDGYVFQSPRAHYIHNVKYRWINDSNPSNEVFTGSPRNSGIDWIDRSTFTSSAAQMSSTSSDNLLDPEEFLPSINWNDVLRMVSARTVGDSDNTDEEEEYVLASFFQLEGELVVPLDASEGARATVLMLDQEGDSRVQRIPVTSIEPGMFLLVRVGGGGEYIVPVADRILGEHAARARETQIDWKDHLRRKVRRSGVQRVVHDLKRHGSRRANYANVRNWMSYRSIKTEDPADFRAVMRLIGLADEFDYYWKTMVLIERAHRRAGRLIRQQLLAEVRNADLRGLDKLGRMEFEIPGMDGGNLTAIRIQSVYPDTFEVDVGRLGQIYEMDGIQWRG